jgi:hypothetical protein
MTEERVVEKVRKLLAKAEAAGTTPEEAELLFDKAQELMAKHAIDEARLEAAGLKAEEPIVGRTVPVKARDEVLKAKYRLMDGIARANHCRVVDTTRPRSDRGGFMIVGRASDAEFVELLYTAVLLQYAGERTRAWKAYQAETRGFGVSRHVWLQGFSWGYAGRVKERLMGKFQETARGMGAELVVRDRGAAVDDMLAQMGVTVTQVTVRSDPAAGLAGREAADRADLSGGRNRVGGMGGRELE